MPSSSLRQRSVRRSSTAGKEALGGLDRTDLQVVTAGAGVHHALPHAGRHELVGDREGDQDPLEVAAREAALEVRLGAAHLRRERLPFSTVANTLPVSREP